MSGDQSETAIIVTLPDGTKLEAIEVEVETRFEGPGHMGTDVPYVCPVDWQDGYDDIPPRSVRLFAVRGSAIATPCSPRDACKSDPPCDGPCEWPDVVLDSGRSGEQV